MRMHMTPTEFRQSMDGFGLAIMLLGYGMCGLSLIVGALTLFDIHLSLTPSLVFEGLVLAALGGGLRLLVRIDKRLESKTLGASRNADQQQK